MMVLSPSGAGDALAYTPYATYANPVTTQMLPEEGNRHKPGSVIPAKGPTTLFRCHLEVCWFRMVLGPLLDIMAMSQ